MASNFLISAAARNAACDAIVDLVDAGAGPGQAMLYSGSPPSVNAAATGTLLVTVDLADPAFGSATVGVCYLNGAGVGSTAAGVAGYFRFADSNGAVVFQGVAGETADTPDMLLNLKTFVAAGTFAVLSSTVTFQA